MKILSIESSCDDTSAALIDASSRGFKILAEKTANQIDVHKKYGGVVPEIAGRMHAEKILPVIEEVMRGFDKPAVIAVTSGPGLITGLMVGVEAAKTLSYLWNTPIVSVNHIEGHIHSAKIGLQTADCRLKYPALALIASGGHTELIYIKKQGQYKKIGATLDDAAGECFDKVAKLLGFDYPGGPKISQHAETGNPKAIKFPRPMLNSDNYNFSFAGLKTSALYWLRDNTKNYKLTFGMNSLQEPESSSEHRTAGRMQPKTLVDFCASFEQAIIDVLVVKTIKAALKHNPKTIILGGGVAANKKLRETLSQQITAMIPNSLFLIPQLKYAMDNAAMIAIAGYYKAAKKQFTPWNELIANPNWEIH